MFAVNNSMNIRHGCSPAVYLLCVCQGPGKSGLSHKDVAEATISDRRLADSIVHDFNNLMAVISAQSELVLDLKDLSSIRQETEVILTAAEKAAVLTKQLLAFSRKQEIESTVFNSDMEAGLSGKRLTLREIFCSGIVFLASFEIVLVFVYPAFSIENDVPRAA